MPRGIRVWVEKVWVKKWQISGTFLRLKAYLGESHHHYFGMDILWNIYTLNISSTIRLRKP